MHYRSKKDGSIVNAIQADRMLQAAAEQFRALPKWLRDAEADGSISMMVDRTGIRVHSAGMVASRSDYLVDHGPGNIVVLTSQLFGACYEPYVASEVAA